jgi:hypothetical protein
MEFAIHNWSLGLVTLTSLSLATTVGLLLLTVWLRTHTPIAAHPKRLFQGIFVGLMCSGMLTISYFLWMVLAPIVHVWYPVGLLVLIGNVSNIVCGVCVLLELTAEGVIAASLIAANQILWILLGILAFTVDF